MPPAANTFPQIAGAGKRHPNEMMLHSLHLGVELVEAQENAEWDLKAAPTLQETEPLTAPALGFLRQELDPQGIYRQ
ncbi:MAG TPA: hypothetical protein G4N99_07040 [Thermoflexia bacterium]|nr:hypothetical protein [Thermoflexia bacterium]